MATMTKSRASSLVERVDSLLNPYEEFYVQQDYPGVMGYVITLKTHIYIHRKHTRKDLFIPHSVYQAGSFTVLPNMAFMREWLKNARRAAKKLINKGEYTTEERLGNQYMSVKRRYNQWIYYNRKERVLFGTLQVVGEGSSTDVRANTKPTERSEN